MAQTPDAFEPVEPTGLDDGADDILETLPRMDRRTSPDRRGLSANSPDLPADDTGLQRRRGPGRRRSDFTRAAEEGEMTKEQFLFVMSIDAFKRANQKMFPTWTEVLEIVRLLGYRKTLPAEITLRNCEDWTERPDTPANVRADSAAREAA